MKIKRAKEIVAAWNEIEAEHDDISTEKLFALVSERCKCDNGDVAEALYMEHQGKLKGN